MVLDIHMRRKMKKVPLVTLFQSLKMKAEERGDLSGKLARVGSIAQEYFKADICAIFSMNPVTRTFLPMKPTVIGKLESAAWEHFSRPREHDLAKLVLSKKSCLLRKIKLRNIIAQLLKWKTFGHLLLLAHLPAALRLP